MPLMLKEGSNFIEIDSFKFTYAIYKNELETITSNGSYLTPQMVEILEKLKSGDVIYMETINKNKCNSKLSFIVD